MADLGRLVRDSWLECSYCGRKSTASFASSMQSGWERCCGYTMRLERTEADIDAAVGAAFDADLAMGPKLPALLRRPADAS